MARLRRVVSPVTGLRQRLIDDLVQRFHPDHAQPPEDDGLTWLPGLDWGAEAKVRQLRSGAPVELYDFEIPRDVRAQYGWPHGSRVRLAGDNELSVVDRRQS